MPHTVARYASLLDVKKLKLRQIGQVEQSSVADAGTIKIQGFKTNQSRQMGQCGIRHLGAFQADRVQVRKQREQSHVSIVRRSVAALNAMDERRAIAASNADVRPDGTKRGQQSLKFV